MISIRIGLNEQSNDILPNRATMVGYWWDRASLEISHKLVQNTCTADGAAPGALPQKPPLLKSLLDKPACVRNSRDEPSPFKSLSCSIIWENLMPRKSPRSIQVDGNVRCLKLYPMEGTKRTIDRLETVGIKLTREQAVHLARVLLAVSQDWPEVDITGYRLRPRKSDGTFGLTVTGLVE